MSKKIKVLTEEEQAEIEKNRLEAEAQKDNEMHSRTARYDQDLKERATKLAINPDNFETEEELLKAVKKVEGENRDRQNQ